MAKVSGYCDEKFNSVRQLLEQTLAAGHDLGASLCVNHHGKTVLDLWGCLLYTSDAADEMD